MIGDEAGAQYQRKVIYPNFFVPQNALPQAEKLPPIKAGIYNDAEDKAPKEPQASQELSPLKANKARNSYAALDKLENLPEYKHKYDDYISDLKYIAQTGKYPQNAALQNDLNKMNSDEKFYIQ